MQNVSFGTMIFAWVGRYHDWTLFQKFDISKKIMKGTFLPYKLIGDLGPMKPWLYSPSTSDKEGLSQAKTYWNFIQSSSWMDVERSFGVLKGWVVDPIEKIGYEITKYTKCGYGLHFFHNICIIHRNIINMISGQAYEQTMQMEAHYLLG